MTPIPRRTRAQRSCAHDAPATWQEIGAADLPEATTTAWQCGRCGRMLVRRDRLAATRDRVPTWVPVPTLTLRRRWWTR